MADARRRARRTKEEAAASSGVMTNARMTALVKRSVSEQVPGIDVEGSSKTELLSALEKQRGPAAVVRVGYAFRDLPTHPVLSALVDAGSPREVLERWTRLEKFAHTRHRTRIASSDERSLVVHHYSLAGERIARVDDLFIWGVLVALLERAGVRGVSVTLGEGGPLLVDHGHLRVPRGLSCDTDVARLTWDRHDVGAAESVAGFASERTVTFVTNVLRSDLVKTWKIDEVAKRGGMSGRALQRELRREGTSFSELVHRARIEAAIRLLDETRLSTTEVAFCVGFSDAAHFSRTFRRVCDVPPTAYRELG